MALLLKLKGTKTVPDWIFVSVFQLEIDYYPDEFHFADENKDTFVSWEEIIEDIGSHRIDFQRFCLINCDRVET